MSNKRILSAAATAMVLAGLPVHSAQAAGRSGDVKGPACADVSDGAGVNTGTAVRLRLTLSAPSCRQVTYTLYVLSADGSTSVATSSQVGAGATQVFYSVSLAGSSTVCVFATTSIGGHVFDRAPDAGCIELAVDSGVPAQAMR